MFNNILNKIGSAVKFCKTFLEEYQWYLKALLFSAFCTALGAILFGLYHGKEIKLMYQIIDIKDKTQRSFINYYSPSLFRINHGEWLDNTLSVV